MIRYQDDFDDEVRSLKDYPRQSIFQFSFLGNNSYFDFSCFNIDHQYIAKFLLYQWISDDLTIHTGYNYLVCIRHLGESRFTDIVLSGPNNIKFEWAKLLADVNLPNGVFPAVRAMLIVFSRYSVFGWSPLYYDYIRSTLPAPRRDKYAGVRSGYVFLSMYEEAKIVGFIDEISSQAKLSPETLTTDALSSGCMLLCSYLFGMRPVQIALLTMRDVRIWNETEIESPAVHLTFKMVKQRSKSKAFPLTRRVKHEWTPIVVELYSRAVASGKSGGDRLYDIDSTREVGNAIKELASSIVGCDVTATDLRHTAAQRLVDAGASQEEVAEFMGHADNTTCLVYYATSPSQAERVNKALGISPIYQQVAKIAHAKFISPEDLAQLKDDQQIAGVPHGFPISGIGGCSTGQPSCQYNPITSCYGCHKFMPVTDITLHKRVLADMRSVVKFFDKSSRGDGDSPAFMQLKRAIASIQAVINELEPGNA
jgi:integrase